MDLFKDIKFQTGLVALIVAAIHFFIPDIDEASLLNVVTAAVGLVLTGHGVAEKLKKNKQL